MHRAITESRTLTQSQARRIWLHAQRLDVHAPFGDGPAATRAAVEHLGYVQIDTIHVIERCHHHILFTRIPAYQREHLRRAQVIDKTVFEYWTHALSYVPTRDLRFFLGAMRRYRRSPGGWFDAVTNRDLRRVLTLIREDGPPPLGQPQAVEAGAATGLPRRRGDDQQTGGHAQDLRVDRPALRVG
jgi:uncharacterized protein YcaQ